MTKHYGQTPSHLSNDLLVRAIDDELSAPEAARVEAHLSQCAECKQRYQDLCLVSDRVEAFAAAIVPRSAMHGRELLAEKLDRLPAKVSAQPAGAVLRRFGWGMALAATLALGVLFAPHKLHTVPDGAPLSSARHAVDTFEVNGEMFVALPYSNPDLPVSTSHIVQMQVPVSSLTDAGVSFEPIAAQQTAFDHSVLADVLVGMDGQPRGVHVLSEE